MKKLILLAAVALLSLGASAQKYDMSRYMNPAKVSLGESENVIVGKLDKKVSVAARTRAGETPAGTTRDFYLMRYETVRGATDYLSGTPFVKFSKETLIFSDDNTTVYIPNFLYTSQFEGTSYLVGKLNSTGTQITVESGQVVGNIEGHDVFVSIVGSDGGPSSSSFVLNVDIQEGVIYNTNQSVLLGLFVKLNDTKVQRYVLDFVFTYYPLENKAMFPYASLTRKAACVELSSAGMENKEYTVEDLDTGIGVRLVKGLLPMYPNAWMPMFKDEKNSNSLIVQPVVLNDEIVLFVNDTYEGLTLGSILECLSTPNICTFTYNSATDEITQEDGEYLFDLSFPTETTPTNTVIYENIVLGKGTPTGINNVETSTDKEAVSVEYYDLSGRRISAAEKGVSIKVEKYADGTSKAVKVMK